jgi:hypothetical protein
MVFFMRKKKRLVRAVVNNVEMSARSDDID